MTTGSATRDSWKHAPMPEARARIAYERAFDADEHARVVRGLVPREMEDKWFILHEAPWLTFHRSWTGTCIYALRLHRAGEGSVVEEAWVNRAADQYRETDDAHDVAMLSFLVDRLLLGKVGTFPVRRDLDPERASVLVHHVVGRGRSNDEE